MAAQTLGVILAGGRSSRFGADKALAMLRGKPLVGWVAERLSPQVDLIAINTNGAASVFSDISAFVFADVNRDHEGPLAGALAALVYAQDNGFEDLVTVPCDAPALRADLVKRLRSARDENASDCAFADVNGTINAVFGLYRVAIHPALERAFREGVRAPRDLPNHLRSAMAQFTAQEAPDFRDIDTSEDLVRYSEPKASR
jgi:molybdopterin-guanine dinucleotide biosynthesis protein A